MAPGLQAPLMKMVPGMHFLTAVKIMVKAGRRPLFWIWSEKKYPAKELSKLHYGSLLLAWYIRYSGVQPALFVGVIPKIMVKRGHLYIKPLCLIPTAGLML